MVGIGLMGHGIASNLLQHGYPLIVLEHAGNQPLDQLLAAGARSVQGCAQLASQVDVIILCVTGSPQVEAVLLGDDGLLKGLRLDAIVIDCSTAIPSSTLRMAEAVQAAGGHFVDAPMTRTAKEAALGRLNLLVGASPENFAQCKPILDCFAENITHAGAVGAGHQMKLLHNFVSLGSVSLLAEAAASAHKAGIDPAVFVDVLTKGGGWGAPLERLKPFILDRDSSGLKFSIDNAKKDLTYYQAMATEMQADSTVASAVLSTLEQASTSGQGSVFVPELVRIIGARSVT